MPNPSLNASNGDSAPQNFITFYRLLDNSELPALFVFEHKPTNQDICNALVQDDRNPLLYHWQTNSLA